MTNELKQYINEKYQILYKRFVNELNQNTINHNALSIEDVLHDKYIELISDLDNETNLDIIDKAFNTKFKSCKLTQHKRPLQLFVNSQYLEDEIIEDDDIEEIESQVDIVHYLLANANNNFKIKINDK